MVRRNWTKPIGLILGGLFLTQLEDPAGALSPSTPTIGIK
jgi:hypothetical protein